MIKIKPSHLKHTIAEAGYSQAEQDNFELDNETLTWLEAEQIVTASLKSTKGPIAAIISIDASVILHRKEPHKKQGTLKETAKKTAPFPIADSSHQ